MPNCGHVLGPCPVYCQDGLCCKKDSEDCPQAAKEALTSDYSQCAVPVDFEDVCSAKPHSYCDDTHGSYNCECISGYESNDDGTECLDIDECERNLHQCPGHSECSNSYSKNFEVIIKKYF